MNSVPPTVAQFHIEEAVDQLLSNDRGRKAAVNSLAMLEEFGLSLDGNGWRDLEILARAGAQGSQALVRDVLADRLNPLPDETPQA